jgi:site-specific DNA-methyltransferase (adenine-specific)
VNAFKGFLTIGQMVRQIQTDISRWAMQLQFPLLNGSFHEWWGKMKLINADCIEAMKAMPDNSVDSIVTDPPYELGFMGKSWDASGIAFNIEVWQEALRVIKPGGHLIAFSGSRTYHRMAVAIEDAGFQIRDQIMWVYGSGFPKSHNISKTLDKSENNEVWENNKYGGGNSKCDKCGKWMISGSPCQCPKPVVEFKTEAAQQWDGWGTALKPAHEPMVLARKPLEGTIANNVLTFGVGGLNIDGSRVPSPDNDGKVWTRGGNGVNARSGSKDAQDNPQLNGESELVQPNELGRFPANFIHDGLETEWAKFFYCAKASKRDRNEGLDGFKAKRDHDGRKDGGVGGDNPRNRTNNAKLNHHPTVKPTSLMQYLVRLVTPPNGIVLDPFMGSGSTGKACAYEGFDFIGIDQSAEYVAIAQARIDFAINDKLPL